MAASQGASRAVVNLARMHAEGLGTRRNVPEAIRLYKTVANVEFLALVELGRIYSRGLGAPSDPDEALKWYTTAAESKGIGDCEELREAKAYVAGKTSGFAVRGEKQVLRFAQDDNLLRGLAVTES